MERRPTIRHLIALANTFLNQVFHIRKLENHFDMTDSTCPAGFQFVEKPATYSDPDSFIVRIPAGLLRKRDLLSVFVKGLSLPGYFGWNWDALEDFLSSLGTVRKHRRVVLVHEDVPFQPDWENREAYLAVLQDSARSWSL
jgi:Barstar (barnase inhibitor)